MKRLNLTTPMFVQEQVLALVPTLTKKTLQNWVARSIIALKDPTPGRQAKRLYTPRGVIMLAFMAEVVGLGISPSDARDMSTTIGDRAIELWADRPEEVRDGIAEIVIYGELMEKYRKAVIEPDQKEPFILFLNKDTENIARVFRKNVHLVVEVDFLIIGMLNRIHRLMAGRPLDSIPTGKGCPMEDKRPTDAEIQEYMESASFRRRAERLKKELLARMDRGEKWTFDEVAHELKLPLDVVLGGFAHSFEKNFGGPIRPKGRTQ